MINADMIVFFTLALVAVASAVGMLLNRNAVYAALFLILNFCTVAVFYLVLGAPFIAMTQVTVYAGAIMVLFLFVIMLLGAEETPLGKSLNWQRPVALVLALAMVGQMLYVALFLLGRVTPILQAPEPDFAAPLELGQVFFQEYFLPLQLTGVLLLAAMVGAILITRHEKEKDKQS